MSKILPVVFVLGVLVRFLLQFICPLFNGDEVSLGLDIVTADHSALFMPFKSLQSAPPLFLFLQKSMLLAMPFPVWISLKILPFLSSSASLYFFYHFIKKYDWFLAATLLAIFAFNPFIVHNSLTIKQYSVDLLGILILIHYYKNTAFSKYIALFFAIWGLLSNVGLFGCAGYLLYLFLEEKNPFRFAALCRFIRRNWLVLLAPLPYIFYFAWFMQQDGATETKAYMQLYWQDSFIPLNLKIFHYFVYMVHGFWIYFFSAFEVLGIVLFAVFSYGLLLYAKNKVIIFKSEITLLLLIISINIILNLLHLYPIADRLYLYMSPFFLLVFGIAAHHLAQSAKLKKIAVVVLIIIPFSYLFYLPFRENNIAALYGKLKKIDPSVNRFYASKETIRLTSAFNDLTENYFSGENQLIPINGNFEKTEYLVSRQFRKFGPKQEMSIEEPEIIELVNKKRIHLIDQTEGYNIYKIRK